MTSIDRGHSSRRPKLLLLAYGCNPVKGSECAVGWWRAVEAAKYCDTWVICEENESREDIERYEREHGRIDGLHFNYVPSRRWEEFVYRVPGMFQFPHNLWHRRAFRLAKALHRKFDFDLAHQSTLCGYREPSYLWKLGIPFVWGPIGGTQNMPWRFLGSTTGWKGAIEEALRSIGNCLQLRFSPRVRKAARSAAAILAANQTNQQDFARVHGKTPKVVLEIGTRYIDANTTHTRAPNEPLRLLWTGRLYYLKGLPLLIQAVAKLPETTPYELTIVGEGERAASWKRLARSVGVERHVNWAGWMPYHSVLEEYRRSDIYVFTSLRDTSGTVVLEALASGAPIICLDHQGVAEMVTNECGIKIPVTNPRDVALRIRDAIVELAHDEPRRQELSRGAIRRAEEFLWPRQGRRIAETYREALPHRFESLDSMLRPQLAQSMQRNRVYATPAACE
jgi:glycosyltransferase involved in cell wall biosynthesis